MDPRYCAQDVVRCTHCETAVAPMYCEVCLIYLCDDCVEKHLSETTQVHNVVPLKKFFSFLNYPICLHHPTEQCELHCKQCDVPICLSCISSKQHLAHRAVDISEDFESKKEILKQDLQELEKSIYPKYQEAETNITVQKAAQREQSEKLTRALNEQGEALHKEIETIIKRKQSEIDDMDAQNHAALDKQNDAINHTITEIKQVIQELKSLLDTNDVCLVSKYKSRNDEFRKLPPKLIVNFPNFQPQKINKEQLLEQFGSLSPLSIETEDQCTLECQDAEPSPLEKSLLFVFHLKIDIDTGFRDLGGVSCLGDEEIWTRGDDKKMKLYNLQGKLLKSVQTKSGNAPTDIAVTRSGDLVYTDYRDRSINLVKNKKIMTLITLQGWRPRGVCSAYIGDLLVIINSIDNNQTKVVRYSGSTEIQVIQWEDHGKPLYTSDGTKYLTENRNLDICVADRVAHAIVVVSAAGKLRFRYTGPSPSTKKPFLPFGITTDSHSHILIADYDNHCIHMLDQDGHFLCYIDDGNVRFPSGLCVDSRDNLFVAEKDIGKVKKIQYYK